MKVWGQGFLNPNRTSSETLYWSKNHTLNKKFLKNVHISSLGSKISQNHLSILKWSLKKYWGWKVWTLRFQMPCRTHFSESRMQRSIISNEKVSYLYFGVLPENRWISLLHSTNSWSVLVCCLKVNKSCPHFRILQRKVAAISSCFLELLELT